MSSRIDTKAGLDSVDRFLMDAPAATSKRIPDERPLGGGLPPGLQIGLIVEGEPQWALRIGTLSSSDCLLEFPQPGPCLPLGAKTTVCVKTSTSSSVVTGLVTIVFRSDTEFRAAYRCRFEDSRKLRSILPENVRVYFNRRRCHRVPPEARQPVVVKITDEENELEGYGAMLDVSDIGLAVRVDAALERKAAWTRRVRVSFRLPGHDRFEFDATIRNRRQRLDKVIWGIEFDSDGSDRYVEADAQLRAWVLRRQEGLTNR